MSARYRPHRFLRRGVAAVTAAGAAAGMALVPAGALARPAAPGPFRDLPRVPSFRLTSTSIRNGRPMPLAQWSAESRRPGADNISPQLSWAPVRGARSYAITMYDPQAPVEGGAVQWAVVNIPAQIHRVAAGAGSAHSRLLPTGAAEVAASVGPGRYYGAAPLPHTGTHDYWFTVWALNVSHVTLTGGEPFGLFNFALFEHTVARASIVCPTAAG